RPRPAPRRASRVAPRRAPVPPGLCAAVRELNLGHFAGGCSAAPWAVLRREGARSESQERRVASLYESHRSSPFARHFAVTSPRAQRARDERSESRRGARGAASPSRRIPGGVGGRGPARAAAGPGAAGGAGGAGGWGVRGGGGGGGGGGVGGGGGRGVHRTRSRDVLCRLPVLSRLSSRAEASPR